MLTAWSAAHGKELESLVAERIKKLRRRLGSRKAVADQLGVSRSTLYRWFRGEVDAFLTKSEDADQRLAALLGYPTATDLWCAIDDAVGGRNEHLEVLTHARHPVAIVDAIAHM